MLREVQYFTVALIGGILFKAALFDTFWNYVNSNDILYWVFLLYWFLLLWFSQDRLNDFMRTQNDNT
jgi:hypothetical protein